MRAGRRFRATFVWNKRLALVGKPGINSEQTNTVFETCVVHFYISLIMSMVASVNTFLNDTVCRLMPKATIDATNVLEQV